MALILPGTIFNFTAQRWLGKSVPLKWFFKTDLLIFNVFVFLCRIPINLHMIFEFESRGSKYLLMTQDGALVTFKTTNRFHAYSKVWRWFLFLWRLVSCSQWDLDLRRGLAFFAKKMCCRNLQGFTSQTLPFSPPTMQLYLQNYMEKKCFGSVLIQCFGCIMCKMCQGSKTTGVFRKCNTREQNIRTRKQDFQNDVFLTSASIK